jgi:hydroxypyruvate isomerase
LPRLAANLRYLWTELPWAERFAAAARAGFEGVEYQFPYEHGLEPFAEAWAASGTRMVLINLPPGDWAAGERGLACLPGREGEFRASVEEAIVYARRLGCSRINCLVGIAPAGADPAALEALLVANLRAAAARLREVGMTALLEPINTRDMPGYLVSGTAAARRIIGAVAAPNLRLQYDVYHMQIMEGDLARTLEAHRDLLGHVQIADNPGRHEPGTGEIRYPFLLDHLDRIGYRGWVGCEYAPSTDTASSLAWAQPWLDRARG